MIFVLILDLAKYLGIVNYSTWLLPVYFLFDVKRVRARLVKSYLPLSQFLSANQNFYWVHTNSVLDFPLFALENYRFFGTHLVIET